MIELFREYIEDNKRIIEYSKDGGTTISHTIVTSIENKDSETINIPKSPLKVLEEENQRLKEDVETLSDALNEILEII